jgi:hypothetical protein
MQTETQGGFILVPPKLHFQFQLTRLSSEMQEDLRNLQVFRQTSFGSAQFSSLKFGEN